MTSTSLDITNKVDSNTLAVLCLVVGAARGLDIPLLVVGATARDLVLHHYYGARIARATEDLDFAIQVSDWPAFEALKTVLLDSGFSGTKISHRLNTPDGGWIDLVPFGPISADGKSVAWPPKGDVVMNILGFNEAFEHSLQVLINDSPVTHIRVVSPVGLALLKLISWTEREREKRPNDAKDLLYLCTNYQKISSISDDMYAQEVMTDQNDWIPERGSAHLLGRDVRRIVAPYSHEHLEQLFEEAIASRPLKELIRESCESSGQYENHEALIRAFIDGYRNRS